MFEIYLRLEPLFRVSESKAKSQTLLHIAFVVNAVEANKKRDGEKLNTDSIG